MPQVARPFRGHDDDCERAVGLEAVVEQAQRLGDPACVHVVVARHGLVAHRRVGVAGRVLAECQGDVREVIARAAVLVHVPAGEERDLVDGADHSERSRPLTVVGEARPGLSPRTARRVGALAGAPGDRHGALPGRDRHRGLPDHTATGAAAVADLREPGDIAESHVAGDIDLAVRLHRVRRDAVDFRRRDTGVVERHRDRLTRKRELSVGESLAERGLPDTDDRGLVLDRAHRPTSPSIREPGARGTTPHLRPSRRSSC